MIDVEPLDNEIARYKATVGGEGSVQLGGEIPPDVDLDDYPTPDAYGARNHKTYREITAERISQHALRNQRMMRAQRLTQRSVRVAHRDRRINRQTRSQRTVVAGRRRQSASKVRGSRSKGDDGPGSDGDPPGRPKSHQPRGVARPATFTRGGAR